MAHDGGVGHLTVHDVLVAVVVLLLLGAAVQDVVARTVSNRSTAVLGLVGILLRILDDTFLVTGAIAIVVFLSALAIWSRGWLGGGDVKLLAAAMLLVPPPLQVTVLVLMSLAGGGLSGIYLGTRIWLQTRSGARPQSFAGRVFRIERWRLSRGGPVPYAVAIAAGALGALASEG